MRLGPEQRAQARRIASELAAIARTGMVLPGSLTQRSMRCGRPGCACHDDPPALHGPYFQWTRKVEAKTVGRWFNDAQAADYRPAFDNARRLRELITELEALSLAMVEADPRSRKPAQAPAKAAKPPNQTRSRHR